MKRSMLIIIAVVLILPLSGCWRYYHHNNRYDHHYDNEDHYENSRGYHHMWN
ncbi:MAG: hypothetical protein HQ517_11645 [SAR324 cluster bacterium]|nr:hypothetical protein [SAR324 cluster bacterium]